MFVGRDQRGIRGNDGTDEAFKRGNVAALNDLSDRLSAALQSADNRGLAINAATVLRVALWRFAALPPT